MKRHQWCSSRRALLPLSLSALLGLAMSVSPTGAGTARASDPDDCADRADWGDGDHCDPSNCGPCGEGEGDCDPGQCGPGLTCVEEGTVDRCRPAESVEVSGHSNFQVRIDGEWKGICCVGGRPRLSDRDCRWSEHGRIVTDETAGPELDCPEGSPDDCECDGSGERLHGYGGGSVGSSLYASGGGPVYPDHRQDTCVDVDNDGYLATRWTSESCPKFRLE